MCFRHIEEVGRDPGPGNAAMYGTTMLFLERIGLDSLRDLPNLSDFVPDAEIVETLEVVLRGANDAVGPGDTVGDAPELSPPT